MEIFYDGMHLEGENGRFSLNGRDGEVEVKTSLMTNDYDTPYGVSYNCLVTGFTPRNSDEAYLIRSFIRADQGIKRSHDVWEQSSLSIEYEEKE